MGMDCSRAKTAFYDAHSDKIGFGQNGEMPDMIIREDIIDGEGAGWN